MTKPFNLRIVGCEWGVLGVSFTVPRATTREASAGQYGNIWGDIARFSPIPEKNK